MTHDPAERDHLINYVKRQCNRYLNGQCGTNRCLKRGGWESGPVDYSIATCEEHEIASALASRQPVAVVGEPGFHLQACIETAIINNIDEGWTADTLVNAVMAALRTRPDKSRDLAQTDEVRELLEQFAKWLRTPISVDRMTGKINHRAWMSENIVSAFLTNREPK